MKTVSYALLLLTLGSLMYWAFTGLSWWVPADQEPGRAMVIGWLHFFGIFIPTAHLAINRP